MSTWTPQAIEQALLPIVGRHGLLMGDDTVSYEHGARYGQGKALCVVRPATTEEVQEVVRWCAAHHIPLVPQGANTGLVGASTPDDSATQVVLSTSRLRQQCEVDAANRRIIDYVFNGKK